MRSKEFISKASPCDTDLADRSIQTLVDVKRRGPNPCTNYEECVERVGEVTCTLQMAQRMAEGIMTNRSPFEEAVAEERAAFLEEAPEGKYWGLRDENWTVVEGKVHVVDDITSFALTIIDRQDGERRPFTRDGMRIEMGPADALHNAMLDLDDVYGEVGQPNPLRR